MRFMFQHKPICSPHTATDVQYMYKYMYKASFCTKWNLDFYLLMVYLKAVHGHLHTLIYDWSQCSGHWVWLIMATTSHPVILICAKGSSQPRPRPHPKNRKRGVVTLANNMYLVCADSAYYVTVACLLRSCASQLLLTMALQSR